MFIYIDDANGVEKVRIPGSITRITEKKQEVLIHAEKSEELFRTVSLRAADIRIKVNASKTQLLCISANATSDCQSYIKMAMLKLGLGNSLKYLVLSSVPGPQCVIILITYY